MIPCTGYPGRAECLNCARLALRGILRPVLPPEEKCKLVVPAMRPVPAKPLIPYAGKPSS